MEEELYDIAYDCNGSFVLKYLGKSNRWVGTFRIKSIGITETVVKDGFDMKEKMVSELLRKVNSRLLGNSKSEIKRH